MHKTSITNIPGVYSSAIHCGIKTQGNDLAYIYVPEAFSSAAVFTRNQFRAAPIVVSAEHIARGTMKAIVVNSGNANAATGDAGIRAARETAATAANILNLKDWEVGVCSTGIIGVPLPIEKLKAGLAALLHNPKQQNGALTAQAIMTTDLVSKETFREMEIGDSCIRLAGMAKGSGMIAPNMGTMLSFLVTDAQIPTERLQQSLEQAVNDSFNMISVDGDTSTNDCVIIISTGYKILSESRQLDFTQLLTQGCADLAKMIARDGEGATRLIEVQVSGGRSDSEARKVVHLVLNSPLFKTAVTGADPNWGRVVAAIGKDPNIELDPLRVDIDFGSLPIVRHGTAVDFDTSAASMEMKKDPFCLKIALNLGNFCATGWGCDLTQGYIDINTHYS